MMEKTLAIIKPDAVERRLIGKIVKEIEVDFGFRIVDMKMVYLNRKQAEYFYREHADKQFFGRLLNFMSSGPSVFLVLEKKNAISDWRKTMGPTKIEEAQFDPHSIRGKYGRLMRPLHENVVHGSDSPESAVRELTLFYDDLFYWRGS
jgi:nucleoside-diphosphate kinase